MKYIQHLILGLLVGGLVLAPPSRANAADEPTPCDLIEVEYALGANLELTDTPMGQGNGSYPVGPGTLVLRFENGTPSKVRMTRYRMTERLAIHSSTLFWSTDVTSDGVSTVTPDAQGTVAFGTLSKRTLEWTTDALGYHSDGTLTCSGSLCGKFGAPPPGTSPLYVAPHPIRFRTMTFTPDMKTFAMPSTFVSRTESPKQTAHIQLAGREIRRTCVSVVKAPAS